tara:strand:+ start:759 stop:1316 length:558 start_codon:yes stop_codon:yes gene_type:complete
VSDAFKYALLWVASVLFLSSSRLFRGQPLTDEDKEALTRMLIAETSGRANVDETTAIAQVAMNRAAASDDSVEAVVTPPGASVAGVWNKGSAYATRYAQALDYPEKQVARVREVVERLSSGMATDLIGSRLNFIHPKRMDAPSSSGGCPSSKVVVNTQFGLRCVPKWAAIEPKEVGQALFSNPYA